MGGTESIEAPGGRSRPSPAIVLAILALVAALAGTAVADPGASISAVTKKKVKKIARKQIKKAAPRLSVSHAKTADTATNAGSVDGLDSTQLQRRGLVDHGRRNSASPTMLPLMAWPQLGVRITTDGTPSGDAAVRVAATGRPGSNIDLAAEGQIANLANAGAVTVGDGSPLHEFAVWDRGEATRMWSITCASTNAGTVNCLGVRSRPG
jgi:hypothetical protein